MTKEANRVYLATCCLPSQIRNDIKIRGVWRNIRVPSFFFYFSGEYLEAHSIKRGKIIIYFLKLE